MRFILSLSALAVSVLGALTPEQIALAQKYAPQFRLTPNEKYFPSSIEYMLPNYKVYDDSGKPLPAQPSPLAASNLDSVAGKGASTWLTVSDTSAGYLAGQNPSTNKVPVYTFIVPKEGGIVDLFYWIFFPYNLGKNIPVLGFVGNHIGDWERMTVRTLNGVAISADYNAHSSGNGAGARPWADVLKPSGEDRPLGYVASGSHGVWPGPGSWVYQDVIIYQLKDETSDGGPIWNAKDSVYPIEYLSSGTYSGDQAWINFQGAWGNKGQTNCWWYKIVKTCPLSNGPGGPYRTDVLSASFAQPSNPIISSEYSDMKGPLSQTLAPLAINSSTSFYKLRLDESVLQLIDLGGFSRLTVEQTCLEYRSSTNTTLLSSTYGASKLNAGSDRVYSVTVPRCASNSSHVDSYRVGLCTDENNLMCSWARYRQLRTYLTGRQGVMNGTAVNLDMDHDNWTWN
ncbi:Putative vacuolar protein sorting-associated protein TDA6 [Rhizoctonia solani]|uniref:Putative vacuolar protein sorting-associated protein TDA6 n=1 Tax=Rhizoctonia solani TaxID=456999 RepID=A0A0K6FRZ7_9AGAM|nr:Putative vacuolar protein sorting-associated protein TDA6 [Rhizoctonia solani]